LEFSVLRSFLVKYGALVSSTRMWWAQQMPWPEDGVTQVVVSL